MNEATRGKAGCQSADCDRSAEKRGLCGRHYQAQRRGTLGTCSVEGCETAAQNLGLCLRHYRMKRRYGTTDEPERPPLGACSVEGCDKTVKARGWCDKHLQRVYRTGSTDDPALPETRACRKCDRVLPRAEFSRPQPICKQCYPAFAREEYGPCSAGGCDRIVRAKGLCVTHLRRFNAWGTTEPRERSTTRLCKRCDRRLPRIEFSQSEPVCMDCYPLHRQERNATRLSRASGVQRSAAEMRERQQGRCAICGTPEGDTPKGRLHVDHDHKTNVVRGLLCSLCNTGIGQFKEDPSRMLAAIEYLKRAAS